MKKMYNKYYLVTFENSIKSDVAFANCCLLLFNKLNNFKYFITVLLLLQEFNK